MLTAAPPTKKRSTRMTTIAPVRTPRTRRQRLIGLGAWASVELSKQILDLPSEWDQGVWLARTGCGTACCIAGKIALDDGAIPVVRDDNLDDVLDPVRALRMWNSGDYVGGDAERVMFIGATEPVSVQDYAAGVLGLDPFQAGRLFSGSNDLKDVLAVIYELLAEEDGLSG